MSQCVDRKQRASLDLKYKVNGDLLLLIKEDLPYSERERGDGERGKGQPDKHSHESESENSSCVS